MRISELSRRTGVSAHRLRRYEALGLIRAERGDSNYREFADRTVREVTFIAMGRELGFSLPALAQTLPRYRAGTLRIDEMIEQMQERIAEVDRVIAEQRALRKRLVEHIAWFRTRQRKQARRAAEPPTRFPPPRRSTR
jgi:MerR family transcriptional regulator, copper efflux regulator